MKCCWNKHETCCQPFPESGPLSESTNLNLEQLGQKLRHHFKLNAETYVYVVATVLFTEDGIHFCQTGCAPNFQGDYITLCTCKHYMRSSRTTDDWKNIWVAGFTSHKLGRNYLFYLMQVQIAFDSFREVWETKIPMGRMKRAKDASESIFGDIFRPRSSARTSDFSIGSYEQPTKSHRHWPDAWHTDVQYKSRWGKHAPLLVGNPEFSFLWTLPLIYTPRRLHRGHLRFKIRDFVETLMVV